MFPLEGGFLAGEPKRRATDESEIEVSPRRGPEPRVAGERVEHRFGPPRPLPRARPELLLVRAFGISFINAGTHGKRKTIQQSDNKTMLALSGKILNDEKYAHVRAHPLATRGGVSTYLLTNFKSLI